MPTASPFLAAVALLAAAPARDGDGWRQLERPLRLKPLAAGSACPASPRHALDGGRLAAVGPGPVYAVSAPLSGYDRRRGQLGSKTIWTWPAALVARPPHVLVRGLRLDHPGPLGFQLGPQWDSARVTTELRLDTSRTVSSFSGSRWGTTVTMLLVKARGCYGLQLDSERETATFVLRL